jgi:acetylornithine/succinyldiaminopimelate/putrescine aminotransferase
MTLGKAIGCGLAVGVMCANDRTAAMFDVNQMGRVTHATTLGGNCVSMAVAARMFEVLERDELVERAALAGEQIKTRLRKFAEKHPTVTDVRGRGLFIGIELDATVEGAWFESATDIVNRCLDQGVLINGTQGNILRLAPPLVVADDELAAGLDVLERVIAG